MKETLSEDLLDAWLALSTSIINEKVVSELSYNESLVCHVLYRHQRAIGQQSITMTAPLTATDLCRETRILKSQMNRILQSMENRQLITRSRSLTDKRQVLITLNEAHPLFQKQHRQILKLADTLIAQLGEEKADEVRELFYSVAALARETL